MKLIDADALKPTLNMILEAENQIYGNAGWGFTAKCIHAIEDAPTITTPVKRGYWEKCSSYFKCSNCPHKEVRKTYYCSHCGSKMEVTKE